MARMFGTDGVRGTANIEPMSPESVMALGRAAVQVLASDISGAKPCLVIGRDTRLSGPMLEAALTAGICSAGADVVTLGILPTAGVAYLTRLIGAVAGVVISASHNPYADNGIKFFSARGEKLVDASEDAIEDCLKSAETLQQPPVGQAIGQLRPFANPAQCYIDFLLSTFRHERPISLRIGVDCANGAASAVAPMLFEQLGAKVYAWHTTPDGCNINHQCGATHPEFLQQKVRQEKLDLGFAFDGDADRLIAIDHTGCILDGDYILAICAQTIAARQEASARVVVSTVMANLGLKQALHRLGFELHTTQVGDKYVFQGMQETGAQLGGEQSGHIIFLEHHSTGDGLLSAVQLLNSILTQRVSLATLAECLQKFPQTLLNVPIRERRNPLDFPAIQDIVAYVDDVLGDEGRVVVRLSGTEYLARVMVEGPEESLIMPLAQRIAQAIAQELGTS